MYTHSIFNNVFFFIFRLCILCKYVSHFHSAIQKNYGNITFFLLSLSAHCPLCKMCTQPDRAACIGSAYWYCLRNPLFTRLLTHLCKEIGSWQRKMSYSYLSRESEKLTHTILNGATTANCLYGYFQWYKILYHNRWKNFNVFFTNKNKLTHVFTGNRSHTRAANFVVIDAKF